MPRGPAGSTARGRSAPRPARRSGPRRGRHPAHPLFGASKPSRRRTGVAGSSSTRSRARASAARAAGRSPTASSASARKSSARNSDVGRGWSPARRPPAELGASPWPRPQVPAPPLNHCVARLTDRRAPRAARCLGDRAGFRAERVAVGGAAELDRGSRQRAADLQRHPGPPRSRSRRRPQLGQEVGGLREPPVPSQRAAHRPGRRPDAPRRRPRPPARRPRRPSLTARPRRRRSADGRPPQHRGAGAVPAR